MFYAPLEEDIMKRINEKMHELKELKQILETLQSLGTMSAAYKMTKNVDFVKSHNITLNAFATDPKWEIPNKIMLDHNKYCQDHEFLKPQTDKWVIRRCTKLQVGLHSRLVKAMPAFKNQIQELLKSNYK